MANSQKGCQMLHGAGQIFAIGGSWLVIVADVLNVTQEQPLFETLIWAVNHHYECPVNGEIFHRMHNYPGHMKVLQLGACRGVVRCKAAFSHTLCATHKILRAPSLVE